MDKLGDGPFYVQKHIIPIDIVGNKLYTPTCRQIITTYQIGYMWIRRWTDATGVVLWRFQYMGIQS